MIKRIALLLLLGTALFGGMAAQMILPQDVLRARETDRPQHVPQSAWSQPEDASSAESARDASPEPEHFTMHLSPNPSRSQVELQLFLPKEEQLSVELVDRGGRLLMRVYEASRVPAGPWSRSFAVNHLAAGIYYLRIRTGEEFHSLPLVKL